MRSFAAVLILALAPPALGQELRGPDLRSEQERKAIFVEKLERDIAKVVRSIEVTEELISRSRGAPYLPDIYLRLAELYVEQARYEFYRVHEDRNEGSAGVAPTAKLLKEKAIETYRRILDEFPKWQDSDKVRFYLAHELRDLGEYDAMLAAYQDLVEKHPKSPLVFDAYLVLGDYAFDKAELDEAESWYRKILDAPRTPTHDLAHFKMGWIELNRGRFPPAFGHFEAASASSWDVAGDRDEQSRRVDVKREALVDLAYTYTEVKKPKGALRYFRKLAPSRTLYVLALDKLAGRYFVKENYDAAAGIYRELARLSHDPVENLDRMSQVYQAVVRAKSFGHVDEDVDHLLDAADQYRFDPRVNADERTAATRDAELQSRDLATRAQQVALSKKDRRLGRKVASAYERYLQSFPASDNRAQIVANLADTLFEAQRFLEAGDRYEQSAEVAADDAARQEALYDACVAFRKAIEVAGPTMPRFDRLWAQRGLIQNGRRFVELAPSSPRVPEIELGIGRSYFESGDFERAVGVFEEFIEDHPKDSRVETVADLILDAFAQQKDYAGLADKARALAEAKVGGPGFGQRMLQTAKAAEERQIGEVILTSSVESDTGEDAGARLRRYWQENQSSPVAERTLYTAFVQYKEARDLAPLFDTGNQFIGAYPKSQFLGDVFGTLAAFTSQVGQFEQAAVYLETYAERFPKDAAARRDLLRAGQLRMALGDNDGAATALQRLYDSASDAESRAEAGVLLLKALRELERWDQVQAVATRLAREGRAAVRANLYLGLAAQRGGDAQRAARAFATAVESSGRSASGADKADAAEAAFRYGTLLLEKFRQASALSDPSEAVAVKAELLPELEAAMVDVVGIGIGEWGVAALHRVGLAYAEMAGFLAEAPLPQGLSPEEQAQYAEALEAQVSALEGRAEELFGACVDRGLALSVFTAELKGCIEQGPASPIAAVRPSGASAGDRTQLEASVTRRPNDPDAIAALAEQLLGSGEAARARLLAERGLEVEPRHPRLHNLAGAASLALGEPSVAVAAFKEAEQLGHPYAAANRAAVLASLGAEAAAAEVIEQASLDDLPAGAVDLHPDAVALLRRLER